MMRMNDMYKFDSIRDEQIKRDQERCPIRLDFVIGYCLHEAKKKSLSPLPHALFLPYTFSIILTNLRKLVIQLQCMYILRAYSKIITKERTRARLDGNEMEFFNNLKQIYRDNADFWYCDIQELANIMDLNNPSRNKFFILKQHYSSTCSSIPNDLLLLKFVIALFVLMSVDLHGYTRVATIVNCSRHTLKKRSKQIKIRQNN